MASTYDPADVVGHLATAFEALTGARTRMGSDYRRDMETIALGATKYQIRILSSGRDTENSNNSRTLASIELEAAHRLADSADERAYTEATMQDDIETMSEAAWWRALTSVYGIDELEIEVERIAHTINYKLGATIQIV